MRFAVYATTSVAFATAVILNALRRRTNFYSACVYLAQSNACLMILTNIALLAVSIMVLGLQKLLYGPLRPIEVEQLYEKAWFAITETCLAMTIFREEVGGWFLVMFVCLLVGKVWGWVGEGRVEILEQQPPSNPRLFHARLSTSLIVLSIFNAFMLSYSVGTVLQHARPNMMVMFAFEFAVLSVASSSTSARYLLSLREAYIVKRQKDERRAQIQSESEHHRASNIQTPGSSPTTEANRPISPAPPATSLYTTDIDVPGWEEKGRWIFYLELATDFLKLVLYLSFFCVLCMFYGMPIHIIRDVALTIRSFHKRILDFIRYRQATRDMNTRYPDASTEEVSREDCCIICREDMRAWPHATSEDAQQTMDRNRTFHDERFRPKKLPCGHVLHFACLRSWLERQQNCPTCRASVLVSHSVIHGHPNSPNPPTRGFLRAAAAPQHAPVQQENRPEGPAPNVFQFGPLRVMFGGRNMTHPLPQPGETHGTIQSGNAMNVPGSAGNRAIPHPPARMFANFSTTTPASQLQRIEQHLLQELSNLRLQADQLYIVRGLEHELSRLRTMQAHPSASLASSDSVIQQRLSANNQHIRQSGSRLPAYSTSQTTPSMGSGHEHLPTGMVLPDGWTVLPLHPVSGSPALVGSSAVRSHRLPETDGLPEQSVGPRAPLSRDPAEIVSFEETKSASLHESQEGSSGSNLPQWGSAPKNTPSIGQSPGKSPSAGVGNVTKDLVSNAAENTQGKGGKGKGRAATVDDSFEDLD